MPIFLRLGLLALTFLCGLKGLVGSITDSVLVDAILIFTPPNNTAHQLKEGKGSTKKVRQQVTEKPFTSTIEYRVSALGA